MMPELPPTPPGGSGALSDPEGDSDHAPSTQYASVMPQAVSTGQGPGVSSISHGLPMSGAVSGQFARHSTSLASVHAPCSQLSVWSLR